MNYFTPEISANPVLPPVTPPPVVAPPVAPVPVPPLPVPVAPVFNASTIEIKDKRDKLKIDPAIAKKAQGIYPREAQAKQQMINNAKMPTPTGAWGAPE